MLAIASGSAPTPSMIHSGCSKPRSSLTGGSGSAWKRCRWDPSQGHTSVMAFTTNDAEEERAVLVMARSRAFTGRRVALDTVFGGGIAYQHWAFHTQTRFPPATTETIRDDLAPALGVGVDLPVSLVPHVSLLPGVRVYIVNHVNEQTVAWSTRLAVCMAAGVTW